MSQQDSTDQDPPIRYFPQWEKMARVDGMAGEELDELPFGAIQLDGEGTILQYNRTEAELSGRDQKAMVGKNFFTEVAPCTNVREFAGRFRDGVRDRNLNAVFPYHFDFQMAPTDVWVRMFYSQTTKSAWVFVSRKER